MAFVIIILVIAVMFFYSSSANAKDDLRRERSRVEKFIILIDSLKNFDGYYNLVYLGYNNAYLFKKINENASKSIEVRPSENSLGISITLKDNKGKMHHKSLSYPITINQKEVAETIKAEFLYFENGLLKQTPEFYGKANT
jgi:hypothetical protein